MNKNKPYVRDKFNKSKIYVLIYIYYWCDILENGPLPLSQLKNDAGALLGVKESYITRRINLFCRKPTSAEQLKAGATPGFGYLKATPIFRDKDSGELDTTFAVSLTAHGRHIIKDILDRKVLSGILSQILKNERIHFNEQELRIRKKNRVKTVIKLISKDNQQRQNPMENRRFVLPEFWNRPQVPFDQLEDFDRHFDNA